MEPAVKQFPSPILGREARRHGGLVLHILIACYMFIGLAIVCDEYFVPALDRMSDVLGLSPDVLLDVLDNDIANGRHHHRPRRALNADRR